MGATYKDSYYTLVSGNTWQEAEANAVALGGHLQVSNDQQEPYFVKGLLQSWEADTGGYTWIGQYQEKGGQIRYADGSSSSTLEVPWTAYPYKNGELIKDEILYLAYDGNTNFRYQTNEYWSDKPFRPSKGLAEIPLAVYAANANRNSLAYFSIDDASIKEGESSDITVRRSGDSSKAITINLKSSPDSAYTGRNFYEILTSLTFQPSETAKTVKAQTIFSSYSNEPDKKFYITIDTVDANAVVSKSLSTITIYDSLKTTESQNSNTESQNSTTVKSTLSNELKIFSNADDAIKNWFPLPQAITKTETPKDDAFINVTASTWTEKVKIASVSKIGQEGGNLELPQIDLVSGIVQGSIVDGSSKDDVIKGKAGWDVIDAGDGNDLIHGGNGRDIITGGNGSDELWGDFGWNTYKTSKDGALDLVAIKSDQFLTNWLYGKAGNNPNGEKADIIEGLDSNDKIRIVGCDTKDLTFKADASAHGISGIGIYANGALEAVYTGGDLSVGQIQAMTSGDASYAAMNNNINSYGWTQNPGTFTPS